MDRRSLFARQRRRRLSCWQKVAQFLLENDTCVDCFLQLAPDREQAVVQELQRLDSEEHMEFVGYIERQGIDKGITQGTVKTLRDVVIRLGRQCCGTPSESNLEAVRRIEDVARLERLVDACVRAQSWEQLLATP